MWMLFQTPHLPSPSADRWFLVVRGTDSKAGVIARDFNRCDPEATHVGIAFCRLGKWRVYHVSNEGGKNRTALYDVPLQAFADEPGNRYLALWEFRGAIPGKADVLRAISQISTQKISFDIDFNPIDDQNLYCSEFCVKVLHAAGILPVFPLMSASISGLRATVLGRTRLDYWPVDFFERDRRFVKVFEWRPK